MKEATRILIMSGHFIPYLSVNFPEKKEASKFATDANVKINPTLTTERCKFS
jgi:hypothetical protein